MSVLERMRGSTDSTPMQIVLVLIVIAFIGWTAFPQGETVQVAVEVDGERVLFQEYGARYQIEEALQGGRLDDAQAEALSARVKESLARDLVIKHEAERLGYIASPEEVSTRIKNDQRFADRGTGKFDMELWKDFLKDSGRSKADVEGGYEASVLRDKLHTAFALGVNVDEASVEAEYDAAFSTIDLEVVRLSQDMVRTALAPTQAERDAWIASNGPAIQADYEKERATRYELPERLVLRVIRLDVGTGEGDLEAMKTRLEDIRAQAEQGSDFSALARKWSEDPSALEGGAMGERRVGTLVTDVREALKDVPEGGVSAVVEELEVVSIYKVEERLAARTVPLAEVQDEIVDKLLYAELASQWAQGVADSWGALAPVEELARAGASILPMPGVMPAQYPGGMAMPPKELIEKAADVDPGTVLPPAASGSEWFVVKVVGKNAADRQYLDTFKLEALDRKRAEMWDAYVDALTAEADVDLGGGEAVQGGWQSWLGGLLDNG